VTPVTPGGAETHWKLAFSQANFSWANDYAEGFITILVASAELLYILPAAGLLLHPAV